jgi:hypothetical protein
MNYVTVWLGVKELSNSVKTEPESSKLLPLTFMFKNEIPLIPNDIHFI